MLINLSPQRRDDTLEVFRSGSTLIVNGESFDFSLIGDGDTLPRAAINSEWFAGNVDKVNGELILTLLVSHALELQPRAGFPGSSE
ncbi:hypothetical protein [Pseudomonas sp. F01002]|uniref:hypothetical protein n=1 Tax=Pseudomonas sp. F01002 TaxID=2555724 RepID=UPI0021145B6E|nr:hypothetical protein [Pseudomonas sp. F01002]